MDGGGLMIENNHTIHTVWQRKGNVYTCVPGKKEILVSKAALEMNFDEYSLLFQFTRFG